MHPSALTVQQPPSLLLVAGGHTHITITHGIQIYGHDEGHKPGELE